MMKRHGFTKKRHKMSNIHHKRHWLELFCNNLREVAAAFGVFIGLMLLLGGGCEKKLLVSVVVVVVKADSGQYLKMILRYLSFS
mmetsp:Transcript_36376/g.55886  ORF Transcript_36376/g.55886 Transcript_36376/m.55886 type:complete len:84 (-) Transcript_36376:1189-1440(-)